MKSKQIIIFDGVCNFCNSSVNFIIARDYKNIFLFTPLQSLFGKKLIEKYGAEEIKFDTLFLIKNESFYYGSDAALEIAGELLGLWRLFKIFKLIPRSIRDIFYRLISKYRYKIFGKKESCMIPTNEIRDKFII